MVITVSEEKKKPKPLLSVVSGEYRLSVYPGTVNIAIVIYRRGSNGYEKISKFVIPSDYLIIKILENPETREVAQRLFKLFRGE